MMFKCGYVGEYQQDEEVILKTGDNVWVIYNEKIGKISVNFYTWDEAFIEWREITRD